MEDRSMQKISEILEAMKFKKKFIGGVDEVDVWKKIEALQEEYQRQFDLQAQKYEAVIASLKNEGR